jgi:hypothetical protein
MRAHITFFRIDERPLDVDARDHRLCQRILLPQFHQSSHPFFQCRNRVRDEGRQDLVAAVFKKTHTRVVQPLRRQVIAIEVGARVTVHLNVEWFHAPSL